ncbi:MAG: preprotein translocase subunit SecY [Deltaproteobacteria bacterium]|nr:preprotein translocase subunit SecY [Deltaproteobacteria bacterium]
MASSFQGIGKIPELRRRILFTLALLAVYRIGIFVTTPGVDASIMKKIVTAGSGSFLGMFNMFSGGALEKMSIFALGIMPYISASIILQLLTVVVPRFEQIQKEGDAGRRRLNQYTRYGAIILSCVQSFFIAKWLVSNNAANAQYGVLVPDPDWSFYLITMISLTTGTAFIMWLGEQITERGIGNGISLIIFAGIVADMPDALVMLFQKAQAGEFTVFNLAVVGLLVVLVVGVIIFFERGQRRIPVQYARRQVGKKVYAGQSTHLPLKVNTAGVIPPIFASSLLMFPQQIASYFDHPLMRRFADVMQPSDWRYNVIYVSMIIFFCYFYTAVTFNPVDVADNLRKMGGFIPSVRPGKATAEYIDRVLTRITFGGAIYISAICVLPTILSVQMGVPFQFGGTGLMIVVGVALDTVQQIESHLITRSYDGFSGPKGPRIRGRGGRGTAPVG